MTTLAANKMRPYEGIPVRIEESALPVIASDIIYEGAAVGVVAGTGHGRPLVAGDRFAGFANQKADNAAGAAAAISVDLKTKGFVQLSVSGAVITDVGQPVYATDDDTFVFSPVGGQLHRRHAPLRLGGRRHRAVRRRRHGGPVGPWTVRETISADKTLDAEDSGKLFWVDTDAKIVTLPAVAPVSTASWW
jgi:hypothetical protein